MESIIMLLKTVPREFDVRALNQQIRIRGEEGDTGLEDPGEGRCTWARGYLMDRWDNRIIQGGGGVAFSLYLASCLIPYQWEMGQ